MEDVATSLCQIIAEKVEFSKPKLKIKKNINTKSKAIVEKVAL